MNAACIICDVVNGNNAASIVHADESTMAFLVARAIDAAFPSDGLSVWHSAGPGANQEIAHLHFHVHPRVFGDGLLRVYPSRPEEPNRATLDEFADRIRQFL